MTDLHKINIYYSLLKARAFNENVTFTEEIIWTTILSLISKCSRITQRLLLVYHHLQHKVVFQKSRLDERGC